MGFQGVVCSDSLLMAGVRGQFEREEEMSLAVLNAGVDLLLDLQDPVRSIDYLCECVDSGKLSLGRVDEALERVWSLKRQMFEAPAGMLPSSGKPPQQAPATLARTIAAGAIEVIGESRSPALPFKPGERTVGILVKPFETPIEPPEQPLGAAMRERFRDAQYVQLGPRTEAAAYDAARELALGAKQLVIAIIVRPAAWFAFGLKPEQKQFVRELLGQRGDAVLACLGVPSALDDFPDAAMRICTYSDVPVSQQALVELLCSYSVG
jgi:hypothetical protein